MTDQFEQRLSDTAFSGYGEYMDYLFACVNMALEEHLERMKIFFATGKGGYKNVLYPDLEVASEICAKNVRDFQYRNDDVNEEENDESEEDGLSEDLLALFGDFVKESSKEEEKIEEEFLNTESRMEYIAGRAKKTVEQGVSLPFRHKVCPSSPLSVWEYGTRTPFRYTSQLFSRMPQENASGEESEMRPYERRQASEARQCTA